MSGDANRIMQRTKSQNNGECAQHSNIQDEMDRLEERLLRGGVEVTKVSSDGNRLRKVKLKMYGDSWLEMTGKKRNPRLRLKGVCCLGEYVERYVDTCHLSSVYRSGLYRCILLLMAAFVVILGIRKCIRVFNLHCSGFCRSHGCFLARCLLALLH
jgi:hypothetical protein